MTVGFLMKSPSLFGNFCKRQKAEWGENACVASECIFQFQDIFPEACYAKLCQDVCGGREEGRGEQGKDKSQESRSLRFLLRGDCQSATPSLENVLHLPSSVLQLVQGVGKRGGGGLMK